MNSQIKKKISIFGVIGWMGLIFWFSAQPADKSGEMSMQVGRVVGNLVVRNYAELPKERQDAFAKKIEYGVRKVAHATEYAVLGVLLFWASAAWGRGGKKHAYLTVVVGAMYAVTDELHQLFVPGRSGRAADVMIDTTGVAIGVLCAYAVFHYVQCQRKRRV